MCIKLDKKTIVKIPLTSSQRLIICMVLQHIQIIHVCGYIQLLTLWAMITNFTSSLFVQGTISFLSHS